MPGYTTSSDAGWIIRAMARVPVDAFGPARSCSPSGSGPFASATPATARSAGNRGYVTLHVPLQESHLISRYVGLSKTKPQLGRIGSGRWEKARQPPSPRHRSRGGTASHSRRARGPAGICVFPDTTGRRNSRPRSRLPRRGPVEGDRRDEGRHGTSPGRWTGLSAAMSASVRRRSRSGPPSRPWRGPASGSTRPDHRARAAALNTFRERMAGYPGASKCSSASAPAGAEERSSKRCAGEVDILIGTHRLLQRDVQFHDWVSW